MDNRANTAVDAFFKSGSGSPAAAQVGMASNSLDPNHFTRMISLQNRLMAIVAEAQTIVQELQQNGFFPRGAGANPEEDAAITVMQMLGSVPGSSSSSKCSPLAQQYANSNNNSSGAAAPSAGDAATAQRVSSPNLASMPLAGQDEHISAYTNAAHNAVSHNAVEEFLLSGQGSHNNNQNIYVNGAGVAEEDDKLAEGSEMLAFVEFKRGRVRKYRCEHRIEPGSYVLVDGDRGTDCGLLVQTIERKPNNETAVVSMEGCDIRDDKIKLENGHVLRQASEEDIDRLHNIIANAESVALKTCRQRCNELGIDIDLQDVEYQFDMKKISFFFDCDHSVDFRSLVRELYRTFGARIWMENINPKVKNSMPDQSGGGNERGHGSGSNDRHHGGGGGWRNGRGGRGRDY
ncbi:putative cell cycle sequence binding phosphoprotein (RBP33) [Leptomonas seymouri]|uniref:Putative cell cycle sequence binding phosphoprotein (RBP33) n=1 Tax=Leptomonas seymouri TaxID=5684 RepID=A0A0N1I362_LEPSE|nr:putative cell cycle sequence binding phosphoprotein (RBP33) [Leptomonas seymouri]|eukprot:KPI84385.1 putative cell cycle sequence binding phosphoprotein (RBP33) [Leptomonas seymouri]